MNPHNPHTEFDKYLGVRLRAFRTMRGITQNDLASEIGITRSALSKYESGAQACPIHVLWKIAAKLEYSMDLIVYAPWDSVEQLADLQARIEKAQNLTALLANALTTPTIY